MIEKADWIWHDGELCPWRDASPDPFTHTLHYGFGAFEGLRSYRLRDGGLGIFRLREHIARLFESARALGLELPYRARELEDACGKVIRQNALEEAYVRPLVYVGDPNIIFAYWLNEVHVTIAAFRWQGYSDRGRQEGAPAKIAPYPRAKAHADLYKIKACGHYLLSNLAFGDAARDGYKQAIFLDEDEMVCEATGENIFVVRDRVLQTPSLGRGVLAGITRATVMTLARDLGYEVIETDIPVDALRSAEEVFTAGTASEIMPIPSVDGAPIGDGVAGPVTRELQRAYEQVVRGNAAASPRWVTPL